VTPDELLAQTVRTEGRRVLATLVRTFGDLELAQDAVQETAVMALRDGPRAGLAALDEIDGLARSHLWHAARAEALRRLGQADQAAAELARAAELAPAEPERRLLTRRLHALDSREQHRSAG
jgi:predicted RNA polymerase sigma factor